ncbi:hypothetical protein [Actinomadura rugatobispora]|uniref:SsgA family sporulation/cell division regulator n=1 Tax=Actinomadura rugatobispora TaxID=1994 RepID=A0ABW1ADB7_9ACTN|nr:hypothetical protein GCM10010200_108720 [Actinomadura rugatobispora]
MAQTASLSGPRPGETFLPATLDSVHRCPARADYIELCFTTPEGPMKWCFPEPPRQAARSTGPLALTIGPYGIQVREVGENGLGLALENASALSMILAGAEVYIARKLVTANR